MRFYIGIGYFCKFFLGFAYQLCFGIPVMGFCKILHRHGVFLWGSKISHSHWVYQRAEFQGRNPTHLIQMLGFLIFADLYLFLFPDFWSSEMEGRSELFDLYPAIEPFTTGTLKVCSWPIYMVVTPIISLLSRSSLDSLLNFQPDWLLIFCAGGVSNIGMCGTESLLNTFCLCNFRFLTSTLFTMKSVATQQESQLFFCEF